jgi:hypothetical protein
MKEDNLPQKKKRKPKNKKKKPPVEQKVSTSESDDDRDSGTDHPFAHIGPQESLKYTNNMNREAFVENLKAIKKEMKEKVIDRTIPRIKVGFINKIRRGLKALMGELTETLKQLKFARFDDEKQVIYRYVTYRLQWHIAARIGRKFKNCGGGRPASDRKP